MRLMDGWIERWMDGYRDGWMDIETNPYMSDIMETKDTKSQTKCNSVH